jgi:putative sigma-54 modulation protein
MRIDVVGRNIEVTDALRQYAEQKASKLPRYFDGVQLVTLTLTKEDHLKHGEFGVEVCVDVEKHADFVTHAKGEDLYAIIDAAVQKSARQLTDFKEQLKLGNR